jgi:hypothetical protein
MWIVRLALSRPYTFIVMALAIPAVAVTHPSTAAEAEELRLPGTLQALTCVP